MQLSVVIDTNAPMSPAQIRKEAAFLLYIADNFDAFMANAADWIGTGESAQPAATVNVANAFQAQPANIPPAPPAPTPAAIPGAAVNLLPTPPAPTAPPAPNAPALSNETDASGMPWDARIHSGGKAVIADGTWKKKRGVSAQLVAQVEAELRAVSPSAPAPAEVPPPPPATPAVPQAANVPPPPPAPAAATVAVPPPPVSTAPSTAGNDLVTLSQAVATGQITHDEVLQQCALYGHAHLGGLASMPDALAAVVATFRAQGKLQ